MNAMTPRFHSLTIADVRPEASDAVSVAFAVPEALKGDFAFVPGQYLTLRTQLEGEEVRRSYSICSAPGDGELRVAIKRVEDGVFSNWIADEAQPGDAIEVMTPTGRFGLSRHPGNGRNHVAFAAGSGITPVLSILHGVLEGEPDSRFFLFYGNRASADILFRQTLEDLKDRYLGRLSVFHVLSREEQDLDILNGHLDAEKAERLLSTIIPAALVDHVFLCGPEGMIVALEGALSAMGLAPEQIHAERFVSVHGGKARPQPRPVAEGTPPAHVAALIVDGKRREVPVAEGEAVLDAAIRAGMDLPYACKGGMCSTCRAKVIEGEVAMDVNYALEPWETEAGFVLTCQSHPKTARVVIDYDQV